MQNEGFPFNVDKDLSRDVAQKPHFPIKLINIYISITNLVSLPLHVLYNYSDLITTRRHKIVYKLCASDPHF